MQVENIECQIAQAQIGHFLAGSGLSEEAMRQLEDHIAGCPECKNALNERRSELRAMLTGQKAVVDFEAIAREAENTKTKSIATALRKKTLEQMLEPAAELPFVHEPKAATVEIPQAVVEATKTKAAKEPKQPKEPKPTNHWKPLGLSLALAAVLICMSLFSKNIAAIFGPKLSEVPATTATDTPKTEEAPKAETPVVENAGPETAGATLVGSTGTPTESTITEPETKTEETTATPDESASAINPATVTEPSKQETAPVEPESNSGAALGASAGALATTQFEAAEEPAITNPPAAQPPVTKPVAKPAAKPIVKAPARRVTPRRIVRRQPVRRPVARKNTRGVRSRGIKVYNP